MPSLQRYREMVVSSRRKILPRHDMQVVPYDGGTQKTDGKPVRFYYEIFSCKRNLSEIMAINSLLVGLPRPLWIV